MEKCIHGRWVNVYLHEMQNGYTKCRENGYRRSINVDETMENKIIEIEYAAKTGRFLLKVPFDQNSAIIDMPGRRWLKRIKKWSVPATGANIKLLDKLPCFWRDDAIKARNAVVAQAPKTVSSDFPKYYQFKTQPYEKQMSAILQGYGRREFAFFMGMGTGKTKVIIDIVSALWMENKIKQILIICPVSIQSNWGEEIKKHSPLEAEVHIYRPQKHKVYEKWIAAATDDTIRWLVVGVESLSQGRAAETASSYSLLSSTYVAVDESSKIKNANAKRTEKCIKIGKQVEYRSILTGTPVSQGPLDLYAQFEFLNTHIFGLGDYYSFRNRYAIMGGYENKEVVAYANMDELAAIVSPFVFEASLNDMADLPPKIYQKRLVKMSTQQQGLLKDIAAGHAVVDNVELEVKNVLEKLLRMQQIVNGFYTEYTVDPLNDRKIAVQRKLKTNPKLNELESLLDENSYQAILWGKFKMDIRNMCELVSKRSEKYVEFHGDIKPELRQGAVDAFQKGCMYFVGNPAAGGMGITLTAARLMVYFSNSFSLEERLQSEDRAHRIGQEHPVTYVDLVAVGTVDELVQESLKTKTDLAALVRAKIKDGMSSGDLLSGLTGSQ